jgi:hypothetical protein
MRRKVARRRVYDWASVAVFDARGAGEAGSTLLPTAAVACLRQLPPAGLGAPPEDLSTAGGPSLLHSLLEGCPMVDTLEAPARPRRRWRRLAGLAAVLGPGLIAANEGNDVGGIPTYASAGAQFACRTLLLMVLVTVGLVVVQEMYARLVHTRVKAWAVSSGSSSRSDRPRPRSVNLLPPLLVVVVEHQLGDIYPRPISLSQVEIERSSGAGTPAPKDRSSSRRRGPP